VEAVLRRIRDAGVVAGYPVGRDYPELQDCLLIAVTEKRTRQEIDRLVELISVPAAETAHDAGQFIGHTK
jgi:glycine dehydrogenase subunit 1